VELNNFMGGRMFGLTPEGAKAIFDKYGLRVISDVTMASVIEDTPVYLERWEQIAARQRAQNVSRLRSLRDIEKNMRTLEGLPYIPYAE
jgi:hypothetical protein